MQNNDIFLQDYYETISKYFADAPLNIPVKYKIRQIVNKMELLDREIKYLLNKVKIWKPKQEAAVNQTAGNKTERAIEENEEPAADSDTKKDKSAEEQPSDNLEESQQEPILETTDTTQDQLPLPASEEPLTNEKVEEEKHQEL